MEPEGRPENFTCFAFLGGLSRQIRSSFAGRLSWSKRLQNLMELMSLARILPVAIGSIEELHSYISVMLLWTLGSLLVLSGAECLGGATDVACDAVGLIQSRVQQKKPKVYVYELPSRFGNGSLPFPVWHDFANKQRPEQWTDDVVFEGPPSDVEGYPVWGHDGTRIPIMLQYRIVKSHQRTFDVDEADVFFIPAYQFKYPKPIEKCAETKDLVETLIKLNPKLKDQAWVREKGPRHLLAGGSMNMCDYMYEDQLPQLRSAVRINREISLDDGEKRWTKDLPWRWYQFPYPSAFHGPTKNIPALHRPRGMAQWLWGFSGTVAGLAKPLRKRLIEECRSDSKCTHYDFKDRNFRGTVDVIGTTKQKLHSTFCLEPPGDTLLRKSLLDSVGAGCIPVLFEHQSLDIYQPLVTPEEWAKATVFIPEVQLVDPKDWSKWATASFEVNSSWEELQKLYPEHASLLRAADPKHSKSKRLAKINELVPKRSSVSSILRGISEEELRQKQAALAEIAPRLVIGLDDSFEDAVSTLLRHVAARKS